MPRKPKHVTSMAAEFAGQLDSLLSAARREGREEALAEVRALVGGTKAAGIETGNPRKPRSTRGRRTPARADGTKRANSWAGLSPAARLKRVNAIRVGRGLAPKSSL